MIIVYIGCSSEHHAHIEGKIDYVGSSEIYIAKQPVHYKYADKLHFPIATSEDGSFQLSVPVDSTQVINLNIDDNSYPLVGIPDNTINISISRADFPQSVEVDGYPDEKWNQAYISYLKEEEKIQKEISEVLPSFRKAEPTNLLELYKQRINLAEKYLKDTPLDIYYYRAIGEYLVKQLQDIRYRRDKPGFNPEQERQKVIEEAKELNFFTFESLHAQRAGIRDFTHDFANTFGVEDSLEKVYGQDLMPYDVKRLGYETLDSARVSVLEHIDGRRAKAYAKMHLIAERIGEMPLDVATPSYEEFLQEYDDFPVYTNFLRTFYRQIKQVSPGQPAVPFSIPNKNGEIVQMKDFRGKYVLLDFWASWCIPCLDEFPYMRELYQKYSREEFEIVAISIGEDSLRWRQSLQRFQNPWPQLYGGNGFQQETFDTYRGGGIPFYILVNPEGNIERYNDIRPSFNLDSVLDSLIHHQLPNR